MPAHDCIPCPGQMWEIKLIRSSGSDYATLNVTVTTEGLIDKVREVIDWSVDCHPKCLPQNQPTTHLEMKLTRPQIGAVPQKFEFSPAKNKDSKGKLTGGTWRIINGIYIQDNGTWTATQTAATPFPPDGVDNGEKQENEEKPIRR